MTGARWPLMLWAVQLLVAGPVLIVGLLRTIQGPALGTVMLPIWLGSIAWTILAAGVLASRRGRQWIVARRYQLLLSAITGSVALLAVAEAATRVVAQTDEDGNIFVRGHHLTPHHLPVKRIEAAARAYYGSSTAFMVADPLLGWAPKPGVQTGQYTYNAEGIRVVSREMTYGVEPPSGTLRVALYGDSFTNGAEVHDNETWGVQTESELRQRGTRAEVLNFGVNGYGMDQAYLRWYHTGRSYAPAIVVFGLQLENAKRNMNLIRPMYQRATELLPFAKPRFVVEGGQLRLINSPVVPLDQLPETVRTISTWPLAKFEGYYTPGDYQAIPWSWSRALTFVSQVMSDTVSPDNDDNVSTAAERDLAIRILEAFEAGVEATGAKFIVYHLPKRHEVTSFAASGSVPDAAFIRQLSERFDFLTAAEVLEGAARRTSVQALYQEGGHYSPSGNKIVAQLLADHLSRLRTPAHVSTEATAVAR